MSSKIDRTDDLKNFDVPTLVIQVNADSWDVGAAPQDESDQVVLI